ncbi:uroporphyrinogen-III synthase [Qipengyuania sp. ASV99]|uniref:uroporphyrinogen-III synthase n=1 Tax=Qipengyuania sp. ASV99 TaxID=3399681 RepID=UPI003A4C7893
MPGTVLIVRPEPGLSASLAAANALGLNAVGYPMFEIRAAAWHCPDPAEIDALIIGSANAIRHGGAGLDLLKGKPVYAVGESTADAARAVGFTVAATGSGGLQNVLDAVPVPLRLLRIAGADHVALRVPEGVQMQTVIAYEAFACELPEPLRALQDLELTVMLHSAAAAEQFDRESRRLALHRSRIVLTVIGPRVAAAAGAGWRAVHVSPAPNDYALLELTRQVCI